MPPMSSRLLIRICFYFVIGRALSQSSTPPLATELTSFNSSFTLTPQQTQLANLSESEAVAFETVYNVEYSQYAGGSTLEDDFYTLPVMTNASSLTPGALLKTEDFTNTTNYSLASNLALSRILYVSRNLNGTSVPASAFVLWPFTPRQFPDSNDLGAPTVVWNHMTSGYFGPAAPSKNRVLWAGDTAPFALALAGYAVVAPDFAGLGVETDFQGRTLPHQYITNPAQAADAIFAFQAAREAFPDRLTKRFVAMGQSQGAGNTWGLAELLAAEPDLADGYLGAVAAGPVSDVYEGAPLTGALNPLIAVSVGLGLPSIFPDFRLDDWLTPLGVARATLLQEVRGGLASALYLFSGPTESFSKTGFGDTWFAQAFRNLANAGNKTTAEPLLIIQGTQDLYIPPGVTSQTVADTCAKYPSNQIQLLRVNGTGHVPTLDASRQVWMQFIEDRFNGRPFALSKCGGTSTLESFLPIERYKALGDSLTVWAAAPEFEYQVPLAL